MSIETALHDHITTDATLAGLVSTRVYPDTAPQEAPLERVTYQVITTDHPQTTTAGTGKAQPRIQIDVWSATAAGRRAIVDALRERLQAYRGAMGTEALDVRSVQVEGPFNSYEPPIHADGAGIYRGRLEAIIWHAESVPSH